MDQIYELHKENMEKTIKVLTAEYAAIRAGRANPAVLNKIQIDYYGVPTPINQMAAVSVPEPRILAIQPWDASTISLIEKAIQTSDIGINPTNDGRMIRLVFPQLTEERRRDLVKDVKKIAEESKVAIRSIRRDALEKYKKQKKDSEITEDDLKTAEKDIQDLTDKYIKTIDGISAEKEKEIMSI